MDRAEQSTKALTAKLALIFVCFLNTIPLLIITFLTNLDSVGTSEQRATGRLTLQAIEKVPTFRRLAESSDFWKGVFTIGAGLAPATVAAIFSYFLPFIMRFLSQWSGALTRGQLDKDVISQLFFFLVVSRDIVEIRISTHLVLGLAISRLFAHHHPLRGLPYSKGSDRKGRLGHDIRLAR